MYRQRKRYAFFSYLVLASLLHVFFLFLFSQIEWNLAPPSEEVVFEIDPSLLEKTAKELQIVETEELNNNKLPTDVAFLGKKNQTVEEQRKALHVGKLRKQQQGGRFSLKQLAPQYPLDSSEEGTAKREKRFSTQTNSIGQSAATDDYLKDIAKSTNTLLSTKEFIYYGYYHRIRERLRSSWHAELYGVLQSYIQGGKRLVPGKDYVTRLVVVLDRYGRVQSVRVLGNSGAVELDRSAVEAFNRAGPFPNPPKGLMKKGYVEIRWDFVLQS